MAFRKTIFCSSCGQNVEIIVGSGRQHSIFSQQGCDSCREKEKIKKKQEYLAGLEKLSMEERIRKLEEQAYNHSKVAHGYIPPPRI